MLPKDGDGVEQDNKEAVRLFCLAANQGHILAQYRLALCYERDKEWKKMRKKQSKSFNYWVSRKRHEQSIRALIACYKNGTGLIKKDPNEERYWQNILERTNPIDYLL